MPPVRGASARVAPVDGAAGGAAPADAREPDEAEAADMAGAQVTAEMKTRLNEQFMPQGVEIADVTIEDVVLPDDIAQQMSNKTLVRSKQE